MVAHDVAFGAVAVVSVALRRSIYVVIEVALRLTGPMSGRALTAFLQFVCSAKEKKKFIMYRSQPSETSLQEGSSRTSELSF